MTFKKSLDPYTLESLIEGLDERGMLVLQVLLGQQAMSLLSKDKIKEVTKASVDSNLILPDSYTGLVK